MIAAAEASAAAAAPPATVGDTLTENYLHELKTIGVGEQDATVVNDSVDDLMMKAIESEHFGFESNTNKPNRIDQESNKKQDVMDAIHEMLNK